MFMYKLAFCYLNPRAYRVSSRFYDLRDGAGIQGSLIVVTLRTSLEPNVDMEDGQPIATNHEFGTVLRIQHQLHY